jgi:hypothetical protein
MNKLVAAGLLAGGLYLSVNAITNEIENQGDRLEAEMKANLNQKTDTLTTTVDESVNKATEDLKHYIGNLTLEDFNGE